jgi:hypothetical protein
MPSVACPACGERGKIPPNLIGARIKCKKCGISFNVAPSPAKAATPGGAAEAPAAMATTPAHDGITVEGLDASAWAVPGDQPSGMLAAIAEHDAAPAESGESATAFVAQDSTSRKEYKIVCSRDKVFEGKFDLARLEETLNYLARQGWVVKAMSTPHLKGFGEGTKEEIVVLLER